jgi:hypothetical protein
VSPARVRQRQRILRARSVSERIARVEHLAASDARAEAAALAQRLAKEIGHVGTNKGATTGQMLAARAALAGRLRQAVGSISVREAALSANEALAANRSVAARQAKRSAEKLTARATVAAEAASEKRFAAVARRVERKP